ncbi:TRAP transporter small permease [Desulfonatronospira sp.]|uniref:TRAP transporter small permease n=1 Tax=Desulfonatronospira sp. TaxID=1962951 RepID=UPI0025BF2CF9|nr:TRAP transporter small permease [Desulfonatronospira sp.]
MDRLEKIVGHMALRIAQVAQLALVLVMLVIVANILMRAWWKPLTGSYELVEILGAVILSMGVAYCAVNRGHVTVSLLVDSLPPRLQNVVEIITNIISLTFISLLSWGLLQYSSNVHRRNLSTSSLDIPLYPVYYLVACGMIMLALTVLVELIKNTLALIRGRKQD